MALPLWAFGSLGLARAPADLGLRLDVPGAPATCTAAYVWPAAVLPSPPPQNPTQQPGVLQGPTHGGCQHIAWDGGSVWVVMVWESSWRGEAHCLDGAARSPVFVVGPTTTPPAAGVKAKWYLAEDPAVTGSFIPASADPCPLGIPPPNAPAETAPGAFSAAVPQLAQPDEN